MTDPIDGILERAFFIDVPSLSLMAEIALGDNGEGTYTSTFLAESFYEHIQRVFGSEVGDSSKKKGIISYLELNLRTLDFGGKTSSGVKGYSCLGTIFVKKITGGENHIVKFSFKRHPKIFDICSY